MKRPEKETTPEIIKWLQAQGCMAWRQNSGSIRVGTRTINMGGKGQPDIMAILPNGGFLCVENKSNGSTITPEQSAWLADAVRHKAHVIVALKGLEDVVSYFEMVLSGRGGGE